MEALSQIDWHELTDTKKEDVKTYKDYQSFQVGDVINHDHFGLGHVQESYGNKIEVLFEDQMRVLTHLLLL